MNADIDPTVKTNGLEELRCLAAMIDYHYTSSNRREKCNTREYADM
jgi:hypothetical protein